MLSLINRFNEKVLYWTTFVASAIFFIMICLNVVARYILNSPILGSVEISRLAFVWAAFLAAALAYRQKAHIAITFLVDKMPVKLERIILLLMYAVTGIFFMIVTWYAVEVVIAMQPTSFPVIRISQSWLYLPVPVVSLMIVGFSGEEFMERWRKV